MHAGGIGSLPHIVIAGAGYAGLAAYLALRPAAERGEIELTVVNGDDRHLLLPELPLYLAGEEGAGRISLDLHRLVRPPARLAIGHVESLQLQPPGVVCGDGPGHLAADGVLVALGSVGDDFGVPGVGEHATAIGHWEDMLALRAQLLDDLARRAAAGVAVVGGGFTGVEIATELAERARNDHSRLTVDLLAPHILPALPQQAQDTAIAALRHLGVRWHRAHATRVEAGHVLVEGGGHVDAATIIWAAGVRANPVVAHSGLHVDRHGRAVTDDHLRAADHVFVCGDCAALADPDTGRTVPPTAQAALQAGPVAALNLLADLRGGEMHAFEPKERGLLVSLGRGQATGRIAGRSVEGGEVALLKRLIERYHAFQVGGLRALGLRLRREALPEPALR